MPQVFAVVRQTFGLSGAGRLASAVKDLDRVVERVAKAADQMSDELDAEERSIAQAREKQRRREMRYEDVTASLRANRERAWRVASRVADLLS